MFGSIGSAVKHLAKETEKVLDVSIDNHPIFDDGRGPERFRQRFGLPDPVYAEYACRAITANDTVAGQLYFTPFHVCFYGTIYNPHGKDFFTKVVIPLAAVDNVTQAHHIAGGNTKVPSVVPCDATKKADVIQIWTSDKLVIYIWSSNV